MVSTEIKRERQVPVTLVLSGENFIPALDDQNSTLFKEKRESVERTVCTIFVFQIQYGALTEFSTVEY